MQQVIENLWIGNWQEASKVLDFHIVTCASDSPFTGHKKFDLVDGPGNDLSLVKEAVNYTSEVYKSGDTVLVHCHSGRSRSALIVVGALMQITGKSLCECYDRLINCYEKTRIHPYLAKLLLELESA